MSVRSLNHPNIVRFFGLYPCNCYQERCSGITIIQCCLCCRYNDGKDEYLVMEYFSKGSVLDLLMHRGIELSLQSKLEMYDFYKTISYRRSVCYLQHMEWHI